MRVTAHHRVQEEISTDIARGSMGNTKALDLIAPRNALDGRRTKDDSLATERNVNNARHRRYLLDAPFTEYAAR
jgi:hypothetical protein